MLPSTFPSSNYLQLIYTERYLNEQRRDTGRHYDKAVLTANVFLINQVFYRT